MILQVFFSTRIKIYHIVPRSISKSTCRCYGENSPRAQAPKETTTSSLVHDWLIAICGQGLSPTIYIRTTLKLVIALSVWTNKAEAHKIFHFPSRAAQILVRQYAALRGYPETAFKKEKVVRN